MSAVAGWIARTRKNSSAPLDQVTKIGSITRNARSDPKPELAIFHSPRHGRELHFEPSKNFPNRDLIGSRRQRRHSLPPTTRSLRCYGNHSTCLHSVSAPRTAYFRGCRACSRIGFPRQGTHDVDIHHSDGAPAILA